MDGVLTLIMMRRLPTRIALCTLALATLAAAPVRASSVFDGTNSDLWLIDANEGRATGYNLYQWLLDFNPGTGPIFPLAAGQNALINNLGRSSLPMTPGQPAISIAGIDAGRDGNNPAGHPALLVLPASSPPNYGDTIAVEMRVDTKLMALDRPTLNWSVDGGAQQSRLLSKDLLQQKSAVLTGGYFTEIIFIARDGFHSVDVTLTEPGVLPGTTRTIASESRNYTLSSTHPDGEGRDSDGDGIPDIVEAEIGLDPTKDDWLEDADGDGWSEFDAWLRAPCLDPVTQIVVPASNCLDADGKPIDTDNDGWSDFDEILRRTNHLDPEPVLPADSNLDRLDFKDYPSARRLYEVERVLSGSISGLAIEALPAQNIEAVTILGQPTYSSKNLLSPDDVLTAGLQPVDVAQRLQELFAQTAIANSQLPAMRLPAAESSAVLVEHRDPLNADYSRFYKQWFGRLADLSPRRFFEQPGQPVYPSASAWRNAFVAYLAASLAIDDATAQLDVASTRVVSMVEGVLSQESRYRNSQIHQLFASDEGSLDADFVLATLDDLRRYGGPDYSFDNVAGELAALSQPGQPLQSLGDWFDARFLEPAVGTRSDHLIARRLQQSYDGDCYIESSVVTELQADPVAWAEFLARCPNFVTEVDLPAILLADMARQHALRLGFLPGAATPLGADASLLDPVADSDADNRINTIEIARALPETSLPWNADTDGDQVLDGDDPCIADPYNQCSRNPILPGVSIGADIIVSEPLTGGGIVIITVILDRVSDEDITIDFRAYVNTGDTATDGSDFTAITGSVTIAAGDRVAIIAVPIFADNEIEGAETFTVEITGITGATGSDDGIVVVTLNDPPAGVNLDPVFTSSSTVSVVEGELVTGYVATATDGNNDPLSYSISGGADQAEFSIDAVSGVLSFVNVTDFDAPADANADNDYEVQLNVDDGHGGSDTLDLVVSVIEAGPRILLTYPTPNANLGDVTSTIVTGRIFDALGNPIDPVDVVALDVNFVAATLDPIDIGRWSAQIPVVTGPNALDIHLQLADGSDVMRSHTLNNFVVHSGLRDVEFDAGNNRLLVLDGFMNQLLTVDLATGARSIVSGGGVGTGPSLSANSFTIDEANNRAFLCCIGGQMGTLLAVDLASGDRSIIADGNTGTGPAIIGSNDLVLDSANNRLLLANSRSGDQKVLAVDLASGDRTVISSPSVGTGPALALPYDITLDAANNRVFLVDSTLDAIVEVDLASGDRSIFTSTKLPISNAATPFKLVLDAANNRILFIDQLLGLIAADLSSGDLTVLNDPGADYGRNGSNLTGLAVDFTNGIAYLSDSRTDAVFAIDLTDNTRSIITDSAIGGSSEPMVMFLIQGITYDKASNSVLATDSDRDAMWRIDLASGFRDVLASPTVGSGVAIDFPGKLEVDTDNNRLLVAEQNRNALMAVDLVSGDRVDLSGAGSGTGPAFAGTKDVTIDAANNRALVTDWTVHALFGVDLASGARQIISDDTTGSGPVFSTPNSVDYDAANNRVLVMDWNIKMLLSVDLASGDRTVVSDNAGIGTGTNFSIPFDMALDLPSNRAVVTDYGLNLVSAVDLASGDRTAISGGFSAIVGQGPPLGNPYFLAPDFENNRVFIFDLILRSIVVVELSTGDRAIVSK